MNHRIYGLALRAIVLALALASMGCAVRGRAYAHVGPPVAFVEPPILVSISPGVWVVRDYHEPIYYVDDGYYRYSGGSWYFAASWNTPSWVVVRPAVVPRVVVHRNHRRYVHYRGGANAHVRRAPARVDRSRARVDERRPVRGMDVERRRQPGTQPSAPPSTRQSAPPETRRSVPPSTRGGAPGMRPSQPEAPPRPRTSPPPRGDRAQPGRAPATRGDVRPSPPSRATPPRTRPAPRQTRPRTPPPRRGER
jgi:hypothetical protein